MAGYYDYVLVLIPLLLAGTTLAFLLAGLDLTVAVPAGALPAIAVVGHAMFVRTPGATDAAPAADAPTGGATDGPAPTAD